MRIHMSMLVVGAILASHDYALAEAQNLPTRRAGLWEIRMTDESGKTPPQLMHQCIDAKTDQMMNAFSGGIGAEMCSKQEIRKDGGTLVIECRMQRRADAVGVAKRGVGRLQQQLYRQA